MLEADNRSLKSQMEDASISTNSYILGPDEKTRFNPQKARVLIDNVLKNHLESFTYDADKAGPICKTIVNDVTAKASKLGFSRYRFVCHIDMFTTVGQAVKAVSRFLWDTQTDNYVTSQYVGTNFSVVVTLFAVYYE